MTTTDTTSPGTGAPWANVFRINGQDDAPIDLVQVSTNEFTFIGEIEYLGDMGLDPRRYPDIDPEMKERARHVTGEALGRSDLASVPRFLRWFEGPYGRHTPAALVHDHLIEGGEPNGGLLESDAATDRYFRFMLAALDVPFLKRWILWAATAMRTRWAVGGWRRVSLVVWIVMAVLGISAFGAAAWSIVTGGGHVLGIDRWLLLGLSLLGPVAAGGLWGRQWGASVVAAVTAPWVLPPTLFVLGGYLVYEVLERGAALLPRR